MITEVATAGSVAVVTPRSYLDGVRRSLINTYKNKGETGEGIHEINLLAKEYYRQLQNRPFYWNDLKPLIADAAECDHHYAYDLIEEENMRFTVHVMPKGTTIPTCDNTGNFSLIMVEYGTLQIEQSSLASKWITVEHKDTRLLSRGDTNVGLPVRNNRHSIIAKSDVVVFLKLCIRSEENERLQSVKRLFAKPFA